MLLRKDFKVKPALVRATIHISGLSTYELTINGAKIGDYLLTPGWTDYHKTVLYDTYDVTPKLENILTKISCAEKHITSICL